MLHERGKCRGTPCTLEVYTDRFRDHDGTCKVMWFDRRRNYFKFRSTDGEFKWTIGYSIILHDGKLGMNQMLNKEDE